MEETIIAIECLSLPIGMPLRVYVSTIARPDPWFRQQEERPSILLQEPSQRLPEQGVLACLNSLVSPSPNRTDPSQILFSTG
jgi:hypothetical protein